VSAAGNSGVSVAGNSGVSTAGNSGVVLLVTVVCLLLVTVVCLLLVTVVWCCWQAATSWCLVGDSPKLAKTILNVWIFGVVDAVDSINNCTLADRLWILIIDFVVWMWSGRPCPSVGKLNCV